MLSALHIIDERTPPSALSLLKRLRCRREGDLLARLGSPRERRDLPAPDAALRRPWNYLPASASALCEFVAERHVDVVHFWSEGLSALAGSTGKLEFLTLLAPPAATAAEAVRRGCNRGLQVLTASLPLAGELGSLGLPDKNVHVIFPADLPAEPRDTLRLRARQQLGLSDDHYVILSPPQSLTGKGPYMAMWTMAIVRQIVETIRLVVPGECRAVERVRSLSEFAEFERECVFPGVSADEPTLWAAADVALFAEPEGYGEVPLSAAQAAGVPVIASNSGELAAMLHHERDALLVEPGKPREFAGALWRMYSHADLARQLAHNSAELAQGHPPVATAVEQLYAQLK